MRGLLVGVLLVAGCAADMGGGDGDGDGVDSRQAGVTVYTGACDLTYTMTQTQVSDSAQYVYEYFYARFDIPAIGRDQLAGVDALLCGWESLNNPAVPPCPSGFNCSGDQPPVATCAGGGFSYLEPDLVEVQCGYRYRQPNGNAAGYRWNETRLVVPE